MLVWPDGQEGTIGGGTLEHELTRRACGALTAGQDAPVLSRHALGPEMGQCCGGRVDVLTEIYDSKSAASLPQDIIARGPGEMPLSVRRVLAAVRGGQDPVQPKLLDGWMIEPVARATREVWIWGCGARRSGAGWGFIPPSRYSAHMGRYPRRTVPRYDSRGRYPPYRGGADASRGARTPRCREPDRHLFARIRPGPLRHAIAAGREVHRADRIGDQVDTLPQAIGRYGPYTGTDCHDHMPHRGPGPRQTPAADRSWRRRSTVAP